MNKLILRCCENRSSFLITYLIGCYPYHVCKSCILLDRYSRGIKEKNSVSKIIGQPRPQTKSETEVTNDK